jgi:hypothetical protein
MAEELRVPGKHLVIHQAMHGYSDGHRLLATSAKFKSSDERLLLVLSDASGPGALIGRGGYITGYPLAESGLYALARTWPAPEMPRPGCVWTHTLLIDFADLATLRRLDFLIRVFRRPTASQLPDGFDVPLNFTFLDISSRPPAIDFPLSAARSLTAALYGRPRDRVTLSDTDEVSVLERLVISIWEQQWPRLRRSFRFCTLSFNDRSTDAAPFDLQFLPLSDKTAKARFPGGVDAAHIEIIDTDWLDDAIHDLLEGEDGKLRAFLRQVGGDIDAGREAFAPLCAIWKHLQTYPAIPVDKPISVFEQWFQASPARALRAHIIRKAIKNAAELSDRALDFIVANIQLLVRDPAGIKFFPSLGNILWSRDPNRVLAFLHGDTLVVEFAKQMLGSLSVGQILSALPLARDALSQVLQERRDLLSDERFWQSAGEIDTQILTTAASPAEIDDIVHAMIRSARRELPSLAKRAFGSRILCKAFVSYLHEQRTERSAVQSWAHEAFNDTEAVADVLSSGIVHDRTVLEIIARHMSPDSIPNEIGQDPWLTATYGSKSDQDGGDERLYLFSYLLCRALGPISRSQAELIAISFDRVYFPLLTDRMPEDAWALLEERLPFMWYWPRWDRCRRVREGVITAFMERGLSPSAFARITKDDDVFADLARTAMRRLGGRQFLEKVRIALDKESLHSRVSIVSHHLV